MRAHAVAPEDALNEERCLTMAVRRWWGGQANEKAASIADGRRVERCITGGQTCLPPLTAETEMQGWRGEGGGRKKQWMSRRKRRRRVRGGNTADNGADVCVCMYVKRMGVEDVWKQQRSAV